MTTKKSNKIKKESIISKTNPNAWWKEVGSIMQGKFSDDYIVRKAKEAFGYNFDKDRYLDSGDTLKERVMNVWDSQNNS